MNLHCSDAAYERLKHYVQEPKAALYACYFLVEALQRAEQKPAECEIYFWVAEAMHPDARDEKRFEELQPLKKEIQESGFLERLVDAQLVGKHLPERNRTTLYSLTALGREVAGELVGLMSCE